MDIDDQARIAHTKLQSDFFKTLEAQEFENIELCDFQAIMAMHATSVIACLISGMGAEGQSEFFEMLRAEAIERANSQQFTVSQQFTFSETVQ